MNKLIYCLTALLMFAPVATPAAAVIHGAGNYKTCADGSTVRANKRCPTTTIPQFSVGDVTVSESAGTATLHITKTGNNNQSSVVSYATSSYGSATAGSDYTSVSGSVSFASGDTDKTVTVPIINDTLGENSETFSFVIASSLNATITRSTATVTINDDDLVTSSILAPLTPVADNFTTASGICDHSTTEMGCGVYTTIASPDNLGNFRMICGAGQVLYDDPIVFPGQAGKSHLHQFFGNLGANANSTYSSLRTTGKSTCGDPTSNTPVNRSGYWMPAMLDGVGHVVVPEYVAIYYKREPASSAECTPGNPAFIGTCVGIPTGLRFITGYSMTGGTTDAHPFFYCQSSDLGGAASLSSDLHDTMAAAIPDCPATARLTLNIAGPDCWDGVHLDSADHRSHMAHGSYVWTGTTSVYRCDSAHPYHIPQMSIIAFFVTDSNFTAGHWKLSCDDMAGTQAGGCFHTDYWEAWSPGVRMTWLTDCTDGHLQCAGGDLGNGTAIKGMGIKNTSALIAVP